jgi:hypothetical protein
METLSVAELADLAGVTEAEVRRLVELASWWSGAVPARSWRSTCRRSAWPPPASRPGCRRPMSGWRPGRWSSRAATTSAAPSTWPPGSPPCQRRPGPCERARGRAGAALGGDLPRAGAGAAGGHRPPRPATRSPPSITSDAAASSGLGPAEPSRPSRPAAPGDHARPSDLNNVEAAPVGEVEHGGHEPWCLAGSHLAVSWRGRACPCHRPSWNSRVPHHDLLVEPFPPLPPHAPNQGGVPVVVEATLLEEPEGARVVNQREQVATR